MSTTIPRKRSVPVGEAPPRKRHLNAALAAHMQSMHISHSFPTFTTPTTNASSSSTSPSSYSVFGSVLPSSSPFLSSTTNLHHNHSPTDPQPQQQPISFGHDFSVLLPITNPTSSTPASRNPTSPIVTSPQSSSSSMLLDDDEYENHINHNFHDALLTRLPTHPHDPSVLVEETDDLPSCPSETRVTLYHPPLLPPDPNTTPSSSHPSLRLAHPLPSSSVSDDNWIPSPHLQVPSSLLPPDNPPNKPPTSLAVVPYSSPSHPDSSNLHNLVTRPRKVIPMPWTSTPSSPSTVHPPRCPPPLGSSMDMEIEEIF